MKQQSRNFPPRKTDHSESAVEHSHGPEVVLLGTVHKILFQDHQSGFTIFLLTSKDATTTVTGTIPSLVCGQDVKIVGAWVTHPRYGKQVACAQCYMTTPTSLPGLVAYLGSGMIKGIGPAVAERMVTTFGTTILTVMDETPDQLLTIPGIGTKRLEAIVTSWREHKALAHVMLFLQEKGLSVLAATKLTKRYGEKTVDVLKHNPYQLIDDIWGIGFATADTIAHKIGIPLDSPLRRTAAIRHVLQAAHKQGHLYLPREQVITQTASLLTPQPQESSHATAALEESVQELCHRAVIIQPKEDPQLLGLASSYRTEVACALRILNLQTAVPTSTTTHERILHDLAALCARYSITLAPEQEQAILCAFQTGVSIITGGPGTGKTTLVRALIALFEHYGFSYKLAAPTGRAAKRLAESTKKYASTIHRLLELGQEHIPGESTVRQPLAAQYLIIDEASMIDIFLAHTILHSVKIGSQIIFIGDTDQLPPVGPGNFLRDCISSGTIPTTRLIRIFRQAERSLITVNAHRINQGERLNLQAPPEGRQDFYYLAEHEVEHCTNTIQHALTSIVEPHGYTVKDVMILCPMNRGNGGTAHLNQYMQSLIHPSTTGEFTAGGTTFRLHDRIMQLRNNYEKMVFNGDLGIITHIDLEEKTCTAQFEGKNIVYQFHEAEELALAYAITIHKSQGSEFPVVIMPIFMQHFVMLRKNLLYTAVTRAQKLCILIGERKAIALAIRQSTSTTRVTLLHRLLSNPGSSI